MSKRILLSPPDIRDLERDYVMAAIDSNWVAPSATGSTGTTSSANEFDRDDATGRPTEKAAINRAYVRHATLLDDVRPIVMTLRPNPAGLAQMLRRWDAGLGDLEIAGRLLTTSS